METTNKNYKRGILAKPKHEPDTTKFKLVVFYEKKPNGEYWTQYEKAEKKNRKYHDSIDFILTPVGYVTRHDEALNKLLHHIEKFKDNISTALLYMNDFANDKQYLIGKFSKDETKNVFVQPVFKYYQKLTYTEKVVENTKLPAQFEIKEKTITTSQVFADSLLGAPLVEYKLKYHKTL